MRKKIIFLLILLTYCNVSFSQSNCNCDALLLHKNKFVRIYQNPFNSKISTDSIIDNTSIEEFYNLIIKETPENAKNPYNRNPITIKTMQDINKLLYNFIIKLF